MTAQVIFESTNPGCPGTVIPCPGTWSSWRFIERDFGPEFPGFLIERCCSIKLVSPYWRPNVVGSGWTGHAASQVPPPLGMKPWRAIISAASSAMRFTAREFPKRDVWMFQRKTTAIFT